MAKQRAKWEGMAVGEGAELERERVLLVRAQRRLVDQRRRRTAGQLIELSTAQRFLELTITEAQSKMRTFPAKCAALVRVAKTKRQAQEILDKAVLDVLTQLAEATIEPDAIELAASDEDDESDLIEPSLA